MKILVVTFLGMVFASGFGCERSAPVSTPVPATKLQPPAAKPTVTVSRSDVVGYWRAGPNAAIDIRDDGTFAAVRELPSEGTWTLVNVSTIKLQYERDPEPRITYRIERWDQDEMDVVIEETGQSVAFVKVGPQDPS